MRLAAWVLCLTAVISSGYSSEDGSNDILQRRKRQSSSGEKRVVCYYTNWSVYRPGTAKFSPQNINPYLCTHLIYAFGGLTKENSLKPFDKYQDVEQGGYAKFNGLKTYNKNLKTLVAIGGWNEGSARFSPLVADKERRHELVKNTIKFLRQNHFDGLDLDWEYPSFRDGGKPRDRDNYATLVQELREEFDRESSKTGRSRLLLTMAVPAGIEYIDKGYDVPRLNKYLDWMNILSYDYHSAFEPVVNHHSPLFSLEADDEYNFDAQLNIDHTIQHYLKLGADRNKLVLGIPTYGRSYTLFNPDATDVGSPADGPGEQGDATREKGYLAYYEICERVAHGGWTVKTINGDAMGPYAFKDNQWVGYDDEAIARAKAKYVAENELGGIMFWSIDNDDFRGKCHGKPYPLIEAAKEALLASSNDLIPSRHAPETKKKESHRSSSRRDEERNQPPLTKPKTRKTRPKAKTTTTTVAPTRTTRTTTPAYSTTTPQPPTTPDPGSDFVCKDEGFFPHPRDCKKYFWCLDSGPSSLGIVAHQFTCPSGLVFNKISDSCDYARNVICKTKTEAPPTAATTTSSTTTAASKVTTARSKLVITASPPRSTTTTTTTTTEEPEYEEYEDEEEEQDPGTIKELIGLIKRLGGVEELEKQLKLQSGDSEEQSGIKQSLYEKVLSSRQQPGSANRFRGAADSAKPATSTSRNRSGPQNSGIEEETSSAKQHHDKPQPKKPVYEVEEEAEEEEEEEEEEEKIEEKKPGRRRQESVQGEKEYVTLRRTRPQKQDDATTTRYKSILRTRSTTAVPEEEVEETREEPQEQEEEIRIEPQQKTKKYSSVIRDNKRVKPDDGEGEEESAEEVADKRKVSGPGGPQEIHQTRVHNVNTPRYVVIRRGPSSTTTTTTDVNTISDVETTTQKTIIRRTTASAALQELTTAGNPTETISRGRGRFRITPETTTPAPIQLQDTPNRFRIRQNPQTQGDPEPNQTQPKTTPPEQKRFKFAARSKPQFLVPKNESFTIVVPDTTVFQTTPEDTTIFSTTIDDFTTNVATVTETVADTTTTTDELATETTLPLTTYQQRNRVRFTSTETSIVTSVTESSVTERHKISVTKKPHYRTAYEKLRTKATSEKPTTTTTTTTESAGLVPRSRFRGFPRATTAPVTSTTTKQTPTTRGRRFRVKVAATTASTPLEEVRRFRVKAVATTTPPPPEEDRKFVPKKARGFKKFVVDEDKNEEEKPTGRRRYVGKTRGQVSKDDLETQQSAAFYEDDGEIEDQSFALGETVKQNSGTDYVNAEVLFVTVPSVEEEEKNVVTNTTELVTPRVTTRPNSRSFRGRVKAQDLIERRRGSEESRAEEVVQQTTAKPSTPLFRRSGGSDYLTNLRSRTRATTTTTTEPPATSRRPGVQLDRRRKFRPDVRANSEDQTESPSLSSTRSGSNFARRRTRPVKSTTSTTAAPVASTEDSRVDETKDTTGLSDLADPAVVAIHNLATASPVSSLGTSPIRVAAPSTQAPVTVIRVADTSTTVAQGRRDSVQATRLLAAVTTLRATEGTSPAPVPSRSRVREPALSEQSVEVKPRRLKPFSKVPKPGAVQTVSNHPSTQAVKHSLPDYEYYDDQVDDPLADVPMSALKVKVHSDGYIECLDRGNFPHPFSCKKFISCAKMENNELLGWEYTCPKHLSFDPVGGICNWSAGLGCQH